MASRFKLWDRGCKDYLVLIPGWATDYRIFANLELNYNYLIPIEFSPFDFVNGLLRLCDEKRIARISLFGWSQGGFLASDFARENPKKIDELILLSIRRKFQKQILQDIEFKLKQNRKAYLYKFYLECFSAADNTALAWFRKYLLQDYLKEMNLENLLAGLGYLSSASIDPDSLPKIKSIRLFHGSSDKIAPLAGAYAIKRQLPSAQFIRFPGTGHIPFLNAGFQERFNG